MTGPDEKKEQKVLPPLPGKRPGMFPKYGREGDAEHKREKYGVEKPSMTKKMRIWYAEKKRQYIPIRDNRRDYGGAPEIARHWPLCERFSRCNGDNSMGDNCRQ
jgi:hypothetical protein